MDRFELEDDFFSIETVSPVILRQFSSLNGANTVCQTGSKI